MSQHRQWMNRRRKHSSLLRKPSLVIEQFETRRLLANDLRLVEDINPQSDLTVAPISGFTQVGSWVYFAAETVGNGKELWRTDGTPGGTHLVKDIYPGQPSSSPTNFVNLNGTLFFTANDGTSGFELWKSDGTPSGTVMVSDIRPGFSSSSPSNLFVFGNALFFAARISSTSTVSYLIEGVGQPLRQFSNDALNNALVVNGQLIMSTSTIFTSSVTNSFLYTSNGTLAGTTLVQNISGALSDFVTADGKLFFQNQLNNNAGRELWRSDGTSAGTTASMPLSADVNFRSYGGLLYFSNTDPASGAELWKTDGTVAGSSLVKDIVPGVDSSSPQFIGEFGNEMFLRVSKPSGGFALWKSNGTSDGTVLVKDVDGFGITNLGSAALFVGAEPNLGFELWRTDGTTTGTSLLKEFAPGSNPGLGSVYPALGKALLTVHSNSSPTILQSGNVQLWLSDGTVDGTVFLRDFERPSSSNPSTLINVNGTLYFTANDGSRGKELWRSDGTAAGTFAIDIRPGAGSSYPHALTESNGILYFFANDGTHGFELWRSDGTVAGTQLVKDANPNNSLASYNPFGLGELVNLGGQLYFAASDSVTGNELWRSDGTAAGTNLAVDIFPGSPSSNPTKLTVVGSRIFFRARGSTQQGYEVWRSDGTTAGTALVRDFTSGSSSTTISATAEFNGRFLFQVGTELYYTDGTPSGTGAFDVNFRGQMTNVNGTLFLGLSSTIAASAGVELWKTNGTVGGLTLVRDIVPGSNSSDPFQLTNVNGQLYFFTNSSAAQKGLWTSDGTAAGTRMVKQLTTDPSFYYSQSRIANLNGSVYFTASQTALWSSDGTTVGTQPVVDSSGRAAPAVTSNLVEVGGTIYFGGLDNDVGSELFALVASDYGDAPFGTRLVDNGARHLGFGPMLGSQRDTDEADGLATAAANGDDTSGRDDEDGWLSATNLEAGTTYTLRTMVSNATAQSRLYAWIDWNQDGDWQDTGETVVSAESVASGVYEKSFTVPIGAKVGKTFARLRIANEAGLTALGPAASGEVEDYALEITFNSVIDLTSASSSNLTIKRSGADIVVVDNNSNSNLLVSPLAYTTSLVVLGADGGSDTILVDYASGGFFSLPGGIQLRARGGSDSIIIQGLGNTDGNYSQQGTVRRLDTTEGALFSSVSMSDFETLAFKAYQRVNFTTNFDIGAADISIESVLPLDLPQNSSIEGGKLTARQIALGASEQLSGKGTILGQFSATANSLVTLSGDLTIGDATSNFGFESHGTTEIGPYKLTLLDENGAIPGSLTKLGTGASPGTLSSDSGLTILSSYFIIGYGVLQSPNTASNPIVNIGKLEGQSSTQPLSVAGYLVGDGLLDRVKITGTYAPIVGPATSVNSDVQYAGALIADVAGTVAGAQYDQYQDTGTATVGGQLVVRFPNGYVPTSDVAYEIITAASAVTGTFASLVAPTPPVGQSWKLLYGSKSVQLALTELSLTVDPAEISEFGGVARARLRRASSDSQSPLVVNLSTGDASEVNLPASVTLEAGQVETFFDVSAIDDNLFDGTQTVIITANAIGYSAATAELRVLDYEFLTVSIAPEEISEFGGSAVGTVTRSNTDNKLPLLVRLISQDTTEAGVPAEVVIPAGQSSTTFTINAVDDDLLDGQRVSPIIASADGYVTGSSMVIVRDYETLVITFAPNSIREDNQEATATITRSNTDVENPVVVELINLDVSELSIPVTVTIPAFQTSATFPVNSIDDSLLDGPQIVTVVANAVNYVPRGSQITVTDAEFLSLSLSSGQANENGQTVTATVTRGNVDISSPLTVSLASSDTTEATVPATIVIAAGQSSATFPVTTMDDALLDGAQNAAISVNATGYVGDTKTLTVNDVENLELTFDRPSISEQNGASTGTIRRTNTDVDQPLVVNLSLSDTTEASLPTTVTIPAGATSSTFTLSAVDDALLDGDQDVVITAGANGYNSVSASVAVNDYEVIQVAISPDQMSENSGTLIGSVTRSNSDVNHALVVMLTSNDTSEAGVPASITIPAGQFSASFSINAVDDSLLDGKQTVSISATAVGYISTSASIDVNDHETLSVIIDPGAINEVGGVAMGTVTRSNMDRALPIVVTLVSSLATEATVPTTVTIPANAASVTFPITAVDDGLLDGMRSVQITASSTGYVDGNALVNVTDSVHLTLSMPTTSMSESGGTIVARVTRSNSNIAQPLTVLLSSSDLGEAIVPTTVVIQAGQPSTTFTISAVDDALLDGSQSITILAQSSGYQSGIASVTVTDHETLQINLLASSLSEQNGSTTGTVVRSNTDRSQPLSIQLASSDTSEAIVPATVTIPADQASVTFTITAVDDTLLDGTQPVKIQATASGYLTSEVNVNVTDYETLSVAVAAATINESGGATTATVTRSNTDLSESITVQLISGDISEATMPGNVVIPAGASSATFPISAVDDRLLDGTQSVAIRATHPGYRDGLGTVGVTDLETLSLSLSVGNLSENGGTAIGTVTRSNTDLQLPITVQLFIDDPTEASAQSSVVIPAGQAAVTFVISGIDDSLLDGTQAVSLRATSAGYVAGETTFNVLDSESLAVSFSANSLSEFGGSIEATVTRSNTDVETVLLVSISGGDESELTFPGLIQIGAGQSSAKFTITSRDDDLLDGPQTVRLTVSATGYMPSTGQVTVTDYEYLRFTPAEAPVAEDRGQITATVRRSNLDIAAPLVFTLTSSDPTEVTVPQTLTIPAGQSEVAFTINVIDDAILDGAQQVTIHARAAGYIEFPYSFVVSDAESLSLELIGDFTPEQGGGAAAAVTRSNTNIDQDLTVFIQISDRTQATAPTSFTIPAGQSVGFFLIDAVDDDLLDGTQRVTISVTSPGYTGSSRFLSITDVEYLYIEAAPNIISENGGSTTATVTRSNTDVDQPLTVDVGVNALHKVVIPTTIVIPAGQRSTTFPVTAIDDQYLFVFPLIRLQVTAPGYQFGAGFFTMTDYETLSLTLSSSEVSEASGSVIGTVTRNNTDIEQPITVNVRSSNVSALPPATVVIPAGEKSVNFPIDVLDNNLLDGDRTAKISVSSAGYVEGTEVDLAITDSERIVLSLAASQISEKNGRTTATVSRGNSALDQAITIQLSSSDASEATLPSSVVIPAGQQSVSVILDAVDDDLLDGSQTVVITAFAAGFIESLANLTVTDAEALSIAPLENVAENGQFGNLIVSLSNTDTQLGRTIFLTSSAPAVILVSNRAELSAGFNRFSVGFTIVDDNLLDGTQQATITITSPGYESASVVVTVLDHEVLTLGIDRAIMFEKDGRATGTVARGNVDIGLPLVVRLTSEDTSEVNVPEQVTIPAGQASVDFAIHAVDDSLLDGQQEARINAQAVGYLGGTANIGVVDFEQLSLQFSVSLISERGGVATWQVIRDNTDISQPLTVELQSLDETEATVPASVTIPAGQAMASFTISAVDDSLLDGDQGALIVARANGYIEARQTITVTDNERAFPWQNPRNSMDVNDDGFVTALDALLIVNALNTNFQLPPQLPDPFDPIRYLDVNANGSVTPLDALLVINELNRPRSAGEGELVDLLSEEWLRLRRRPM